MRNDLKVLRACYSCEKPYMLPLTPARNVEILEIEEDPAEQWACDDYCGHCNQEAHNAKAYLEQSYVDAREERIAIAQQEYAEWRLEQFEKRIAENQRQQILADEHKSAIGFWA